MAMKHSAADQLTSSCCTRRFQSWACTIPALKRGRYLPQTWPKHTAIPGLASNPSGISSLLSAKRSTLISSSKLGFSKRCSCNCFRYGKGKRKSISNPCHGHSSERSTRGYEWHGKTTYELCVSMDRVSCLSLAIRGRWLECSKMSGMVLVQKGGFGCRGNGNRVSGTRRAIPENAFWITAGQAMAVPFLLVAVTVISSLAIEKRLENEAIEQIEEMERFRKAASLEQATIDKSVDFINKANVEDEGNVILARPRHRPIREE